MSKQKTTEYRISDERAKPILVEALKLTSETGGPVTASEIGTNAVYLARCVRQGLLRYAGTRKTSPVGRPAVTVKLTDKGRKRAKRALQVA